MSVLSKTLAAILVTVLMAGAVCIAADKAEPTNTDGRAQSPDALTAGKAALQDGLYEKAQKEFEGVLAAKRTTPSASDEAALMLLTALCEQRKYDDMLTLLKVRTNWTQQTRDAGALQFWRAQALRGLKRNDEALVELADFEKKHLDGEYTVMAQRLAGWCYFDTGKTNKAVEIFERLAKEHADAPEMATNMLEWGRALLATGEVARAEDILTKLAVPQTDTTVAQEAQYWLAQAQVRGRKWQDATNLLSSLGNNQKAADDLRAQAFYLLAMACDGMSNRNDAVAAPILW
jgi:outer membrane protein assembly factor BamD (BamD/ComL family)